MEKERIINGDFPYSRRGIALIEAYGKAYNVKIKHKHL